MDKNKTKVIFGARNNLLDRDDSDGSGFDGSLKNPIFNGYSLGLWNTDEQNLNPDSDHNVDDSEKLSRQCYKPRTGKIIFPNYLAHLMAKKMLHALSHWRPELRYIAFTRPNLWERY